MSFRPSPIEGSLRSQIATVLFPPIMHSLLSFDELFLLSFSPSLTSCHPPPFASPASFSLPINHSPVQQDLPSLFGLFLIYVHNSVRIMETGFSIQLNQLVNSKTGEKGSGGGLGKINKCVPKREKTVMHTLTHIACTLPSDPLHFSDLLAQC